MSNSTFLYWLIPFAIVAVWLTLTYRKRAMRRLAKRLRFEYLGRKFPDGFTLPGGPMGDKPWGWNVITGVRHGHRIVVFDSIIGREYGDRGRYCSFFAVQASENPFEMKRREWKLLQSDGWFALYWKGPYNSFITWTMSIGFIEGVVMYLNAHLGETVPPEHPQDPTADPHVGLTSSSG